MVINMRSKSRLGSSTRASRSVTIQEMRYGFGFYDILWMGMSATVVSPGERNGCVIAITACAAGREDG